MRKNLFFVAVFSVATSALFAACASLDDFERVLNQEETAYQGVVHAATGQSQDASSRLKDWDDSIERLRVEADTVYARYQHTQMDERGAGKAIALSMRLENVSGRNIRLTLWVPADQVALGEQRATHIQKNLAYLNARYAIRYDGQHAPTGLFEVAVRAR